MPVNRSQSSCSSSATAAGKLAGDTVLRAPSSGDKVVTAKRGDRADGALPWLSPPPRSEEADKQAQERWRRRYLLEMKLHALPKSDLVRETTARTT